MQTLYRFNVTLTRQDCPDVVRSVVASTAAIAKRKAHHNMTRGLPFFDWKVSDLKTVRLEKIEPGPVLFTA